MGSVFLICSLILFAAGGFFVMDHVDQFLVRNCRSGREDSEEGNVIRIAFEDPVMADSIKEAAETFTKNHRDSSFCLYMGSSADIMKKLDRDMIDVGFLKEDRTSVREGVYDTLELSLRPGIVTAVTTGMTIEPLEHSAISTEAVWKNDTPKGVRSEFIKRMRDCFTGYEVQGNCVNVKYQR